MTLLIRGIIRYLFMGPIHWLLTIISYFLVPILVLFQKDGWLPNWCWWFQTWDNSLDGDAGWQKTHPVTTGFKQYLNRVLWLYRNPVYGFERKVLGAKITTKDTFQTLGDLKIGVVSNYYGTTLSVIKTLENKTYFEFAWAKPLFGKVFNGMIGWKLRYANLDITLGKGDQIVPIVSTARFGDKN